ncbi:MAG: hypothetical protein AAFP68_00020 [Pseudomonadota bacterium]
MISYFHKAIISVSMAVLLAACAVTADKIVEDGGTKLSSAEIQALYGAGASIAWTSSSGASGTATYAPDGAANVKFGSNDWVGTWRAGDDALCTSYPERGNGEERCFPTFKKASGGYTWFRPDGSHGGDFTIVQ